ncbi:OLC1v1015620C1 [Oldenlandia corymbosa var. corymbosa]|uniref:OLC1v1015620C1 n=1 Tax=Oldenlandia corymbosa var. corymbosa TaxID=529605 RepID=A0AAV1E4J1_OLDCO|nr:OLC1v1015620C1 [Oldenlandia corymbosa var. corymbosa]
MEYEANQILNRNRAQAAGRPYGNQNIENRHNPQQQWFWGQRGGRHRLDLGNEFRQQPDVMANVNLQQDFEVGVEQTLNPEETFSRMVEDIVRKELGTEIPEFSGEDEERPEDYISLFELQYSSVSNNALIKLRLFPYSLERTAFDWDTAQLAIVDLSEIRQKFGETAENSRLQGKASCCTAFRPIFESFGGYSKKMREGNQGKAKQWFNKNSVAEVNQNHWVQDEDDDEYDVNVVEIVNVRNYICDALRRPVVPHSYNTPPPVGAPPGTPGQADGANIGRTWVQKETQLDPEQEKLRVVSYAILSSLNQNRQANTQHPERRQDHQSLVWHRIKRLVPLSNVAPRAVRTASIHERKRLHVTHPKFPNQASTGVRMIRTQKCRWQQVMNKQARVESEKEKVLAKTESPVQQDMAIIRFSGQEERRPHLWGKSYIYFPPVNIVTNPFICAVLVSKTVAHRVAVPEATSFVMGPHDTTVGGIQLLSQEGRNQVIMLSQPAEDVASHLRQLYI